MPKIMTKVMTAKMIMFRGLGYNQKEVAKELGVAAGTISYNLRKMKKFAEEYGAEDTFQFHIKALDFKKVEK